jgi:hypothetical protein
VSVTTSADIRAALYAPSTDKVLIDLITIEHDDLGAPERICTDKVSIISRGNTYRALPVAISMPNDTEGEPPRVSLVVDNVSRELVITVRSIETPPTVTVETIVASAPDTVELGPFVYEADQVELDKFELRLDLALEALHREPYPAPIFNPAAFPLIFNAVDR